ncbi:type II toxin-antitoxin system ParD family antitoxin [Brevundimonas aurantiaca]|jgi:putative addiction module CopG family antidote|uniref:type II toxin-antitoxin system ParD family antitoxin n=1 Tax=Brevundimonas aurantiaca TaxID=74316 RepID=UPI001D1962F8|nr:type II toxin-antitoxin system ParD family antitoxin [Brevundimonas aurantiaca]MCC4293473.1 type II toxin-antitoxin system ParD family antitoxin [Brevundimonas aurantiaca]
MTTFAVHLSEQLEAFVDEKVGSGAFSDRSAVIQSALSDMLQQETQLTALKSKIQDGLDELDAGLGIEVENIEAWLDSLGR